MEKALTEGVHDEDEKEAYRLVSWALRFIVWFAIAVFKAYLTCRLTRRSSTASVKR